MRRAQFLILMAAAVALFSCSTLRTSMDYDRGAEFASYKTFAFKDVAPARNEILDRRIKTALEATLTTKGLRRDDTRPDVWVFTHARLNYETEVLTYHAGWGYGWRWGDGLAVTKVLQVPIGTLIVDLVDARANELVWRGRASDLVDVDATPSEKERAIANAVSKMLEAYPPPMR